jgi:hypothetical protein
MSMVEERRDDRRREPTPTSRDSNHGDHPAGLASSRSRDQARHQADTRDEAARPGATPSPLSHPCRGRPHFGLNLRVAPDGKIKMVFAPPGLIQAIWLQLAFAMCADAKLFRCERCGTPFVVGAGSA